MSNLIWKTREEKPKGFSFILEHYKSYDFDNNKDINTYNVFETGGNPQNPFDGNTIRWCYLDELLAQADKAERLQKAVDLAVLRLEQGKRKFGKSTMGPNKEIAMLCEIVIDEIKKLTQEE